MATSLSAIAAWQSPSREGIEPVIKVVMFGNGAEAQAARIRLANVSNIGGAAFLAKDRKRQAEHLYKSGLTQTAIANMLGVSQQHRSAPIFLIYQSLIN